MEGEEPEVVGDVEVGFVLENPVQEFLGPGEILTHSFIKNSLEKRNYCNK